MDLTPLRYFLQIARTGSVTAAARALGVSQPSLSVAIRALEEELGATLFVRTREGMRLTPPGSELQARTEEIFQLIDETARRVRDLVQGEVGEFVIGCNEALGSYFLPGFLPSFLADYPGISLEIRSRTSADVRQEVLERALHFGIVVNPEPHLDLVLLPLFSDEIRVYAPYMEPGSARASRLSISPDLDAAAERARRILREGPLLFADRPVFREMIRSLGERGYPASRLLPCGDLHLVRSLAEAGVGPSLLPGRVARLSPARALRPLHPALPVIQDTVQLIYRADTPKTRAFVRLKDALAAYGRAIDV